MSDQYRPRLSIDLTDEQAHRLNKHLEYGMRKMVFQMVVDDLIRLFDKYGAPMVIGALTERAIGLKEICQLKGLGNGNDTKPR